MPSNKELREIARRTAREARRTTERIEEAVERGDYWEAARLYGNLAVGAEHAMIASMYQAQMIAEQN